MNRYAVHDGDRSMFVDVKPDKTVEIQIGDRAYGRFQKVVVPREDIEELAEWLLTETRGATS